MKIGSAVLELLGDSAQFRAEMEGAAKRFQAVGDRMVKVGRTMTRRVTAPLVGIASAAAYTAANFEKEMSKIVGLVGVAGDQVDQWGRDILEMAPRLGKAPQELAEGLFFVTSAGFRGAEAMSVLESAAKASAAGMGDVATIADLVTSAVNAYGIEALSAGKATDVLTAAVREGKLAPEELAGAMGQVLPVASSMGISFDQVGAAMAAMSRTGTNAAVAATQLRQIMVSLLKPSQQAEEALAGMGLSARDLREQIREKGLLSVLQTLAERFEGNDEAAAQVFGNIRALAGVMDLMGANAEGTAAIFGELEDATGALDHAFDTASETARFKFDAAMAQLRVTGITIGQDVLPLVVSVLERLEEMLRAVTARWSDMREGTRRLIIVSAALVAAIGPVLVGLGLTAKALLSIATTSVAAVTGINKLISGLARLRGAMLLTKVAMGPVGWVLLGLTAAVAGGVAAWRRWGDTISLTVRATVTVLRDRLAVAAEALRGFAEWVSRATRSVATAFVWMRDNALQPVADFVGGVRAQLIDRLGGILSRAAGAFVRFARAINPPLNRALNEAKQFVDDVDGEMDRLKWVVLPPDAEDMGAGFKPPPSAEWEEAAAIIEEAMNAINNAMGAATEKARTFTSAMADLREQIADRAFTAAVERAFGALAEKALVGVEAARTLGAEAVALSRRAQEGIDAWVDSLEGLGEQARESSGMLDALGNRMVHVADRGADAFVDFATGSKRAIGDFVNYVLRELGRLMVRMLAIRALTAMAPGSGFLAQALQIGARASGGPVHRHRPYLVGEHGPELFVPASHGHIVPHGQLATAGPVQIEVRVPPAPDPITLARDRQWLRALAESGEALKDHGYRFEGGS